MEDYGKGASEGVPQRNVSEVPQCLRGVSQRCLSASEEVPQRNVSEEVPQRNVPEGHPEKYWGGGIFWIPTTS